PEIGALWGNIPQSYSMAGIINSAIRLSIRWEEVGAASHRSLEPGRGPRHRRAAPSWRPRRRRQCSAQTARGDLVRLEREGGGAWRCPAANGRRAAAADVYYARSVSRRFSGILQR